MSSPWSPTQYLKFEDERTRPARDLLTMVPLATVRRAVDIGCGPGNSTELLAERYPDAEITGLDSSAEMLEAARKRLPKVTFVEADVATWQPQADTDLLYANATFQWVPDHPAVLQVACSMRCRPAACSPCRCRTMSRRSRRTR